MLSASVYLEIREPAVVIDGQEVAPAVVKQYKLELDELYDVYRGQNYESSLGSGHELGPALLAMSGKTSFNNPFTFYVSDSPPPEPPENPIDPEQLAALEARVAELTGQVQTLASQRDQLAAENDSARQLLFSLEQQIEQWATPTSQPETQPAG